MSDVDGLRQRRKYKRRESSWLAEGMCQGVHPEMHRTPMTVNDDFPVAACFACERAADALLPVVTAWAEQQARQRAAEELRAAAAAIDDDRRVSEARDLGQAQRVAGEARSVVLERAAALADDGQP